jgi:hypothetical protein
MYTIHQFVGDCSVVFDWLKSALLLPKGTGLAASAGQRPCLVSRRAIASWGFGEGEISPIFAVGQLPSAELSGSYQKNVRIMVRVHLVTMKTLESF